MQLGGGSTDPPFFFKINTLMLIKDIVTLQIYYWMPDYNTILQEFVWQTKDIVPEIPRVHKFLNFWHSEIDAVIEEVNVSFTKKTDFRSADIWLRVEQ